MFPPLLFPLFFFHTHCSLLLSHFPTPLAFCLTCNSRHPRELHCSSAPFLPPREPLCLLSLTHFRSLVWVAFVEVMSFCCFFANLRHNLCACLSPTFERTSCWPPQQKLFAEQTQFQLSIFPSLFFLSLFSFCPLTVLSLVSAPLPLPLPILFAFCLTCNSRHPRELHCSSAPFLPPREPLCLLSLTHFCSLSCSTSCVSPRYPPTRSAGASTDTQTHPANNKKQGKGRRKKERKRRQ